MAKKGKKMAAVNYPSDFPLAQLTSLATTLRAGDAWEKKDRVAKDVWHVQGWGLRQGFGDPDAVGFQAAADAGFAGCDGPAIKNDAEAADCCDKLAAMQKGDAAFAGLDWKKLMKALLTYLLPLILA